MKNREARDGIFRDDVDGVVNIVAIHRIGEVTVYLTRIYTQLDQPLGSEGNGETGR